MDRKTVIVSLAGEEMIAQWPFAGIIAAKMETVSNQTNANVAKDGGAKIVPNPFV